MENRLKKERRRLLLRIILIILPCWLIVSTLFCVFRLNLEASKAKNDGFTALSLFTMELAKAKGNEDFVKTATALANTKELFYQDKNLNRQLTISSQNEEIVYFDSGCTVSLPFRIQREPSRSEDITAQIDYRTITSVLTEEQLHEIKTYLNKKRNDGNYYELVCTKLQQIGPALKTIPLELTLVLVDGKDPTALIDSHVKIYTLAENCNDRYMIYNSSEAIMNNVVKRNVIPKDFLFGGKYYKSLITELTPEQRRQNNHLFQQEGNNLYYANAFVPYGQNNNTWLVEYAQKVDIVENCKNELTIALSVIFSFFAFLSIILCSTLWFYSKRKLIKEQQRLNITNALVHDVKTPLFVISGYAQCLKEDIDHEERALYIEKIMEQADAANRLVCQMLNYNKLDSYKLALHRTDFDLFELAADILQNYTVLPNHKSIVLTHSGDNTVNADKELIKTVLQNVTDNAVKYALPDSEIHITITGTTYSVSNRTEPISSEELQHLQQPFVHKDRGNRQKGSGLGLSIVKSILKLHDAALSIKMKDDTFICSFKL